MSESCRWYNSSVSALQLMHFGTNVTRKFMRISKFWFFMEHIQAVTVWQLVRYCAKSRLTKAAWGLNRKWLKISRSVEAAHKETAKLTELCSTLFSYADWDFNWKIGHGLYPPASVMVTFSQHETPPVRRPSISVKKLAWVQTPNTTKHFSPQMDTLSFTGEVFSMTMGDLELRQEIH
jgi:hypothetical protein